MNGQASLTDELARRYSADHALLCGSGTQALQIAITLAMRQVGDSTVALPAFTCFDVATAAVGARAKIRFFDLDPSTLSPDLSSLEAALARGTRIVVVSHLYGFPVDWDALADLLARYGAIAVEDAAQGDHADWRGRILGSLGPISVLSFGRGKGWTGGSGGAVLVRDHRAGPACGTPWVACRASRAGVSPRSACSLHSPPSGHSAGPQSTGSLTRFPGFAGETVYREPASPRP
jgi:dTDP-4-amino-4,6-dideoxygalactose transaminase